MYDSSKKGTMFQKETAKIQNFFSQEAFNAWAKINPELFAKIFPSYKELKYVVTCMDEGCGCSQKEEAEYATLDIAGSGILLSETPEEAAKLLWENYLRRIFEMGGFVTEITGHAGCGAAKLDNLQNECSQEDHDTAANLKIVEIVNIINIEYLPKLKKGLGQNFVDIQHAFIDTENLARSDQYHHAVGVFINTCEKTSINLSSSRDFPDAFTVEAGNANDVVIDAAIAQTVVAINIATDESHGHGLAVESGFSAENPFRIIIIKDSDESSVYSDTFKAEENPYILSNEQKEFASLRTVKLVDNLKQKYTNTQNLFKKGVIVIVEINIKAK